MAGVSDGGKSRWPAAVSLEEKLQILEESRQPNTTVAEALRRHQVDPTTFYRWEQQAKDTVREALSRDRRRTESAEKDREVERLRAELMKKCRVIAEVIEENLDLKNTFQLHQVVWKTLRHYYSIQKALTVFLLGLRGPERYLADATRVLLRRRTHRLSFKSGARMFKGALIVVLTLSVWGCEPSTEPPTNGRHAVESEAGRVMIPDHTRVQARAEPPGLTRAGLLAQIISMYPELAEDAAVMASLRGEMGATRIVSLPEKYAGAASLVAELYALDDDPVR